MKGKFGNMGSDPILPNFPFINSVIEYRPNSRRIHMRKIFVLGLFITVICSTTLWAQGPPVPTKERPLPEGPAKAIVQKACVSCHLITFITTAQHPAAEWKLLVERMVSDGAEVPPNQVDMVADYLAKAFPVVDVPKAVIIPGTAK